MLLEADKYKPSILNANEQMLTHLKQRDSLQVSTNSFHYVITINNKLTFLSRSVLNENKTTVNKFVDRQNPPNPLPLHSSSKLKELLSLWD